MTKLKSIPSKDWDKIIIFADRTDLHQRIIDSKIMSETMFTKPEGFNDSLSSPTSNAQWFYIKFTSVEVLQRFKDFTDPEREIRVMKKDGSNYAYLSIKIKDLTMDGSYLADPNVKSNYLYLGENYSALHVDDNISAINRRLINKRSVPVSFLTSSDKFFKNYRPQSEEALKFFQSLLTDEQDNFEIGYLPNSVADPVQVQTLQETNQQLITANQNLQTQVQALITDKENLEARINTLTRQLLASQTAQVGNRG